MSANSRLTIAAHVLVWTELHQRDGHEVSTSEQIAESVGTHPVLIRRCLGELRRSGLVEARRGVGAGWRLRRELSSISLLELYRAVEPGPLFAMHHRTPDQQCPVGCGIQPAVQRVYDSVEEALRREMAQTTVADLLREVVAASR